MVLWFFGTSTLTVWAVFRDARFDYRLLLVGSIVPDVIDLPSGQARWAHGLVVSVAVLAVVMVTTGRKPVRRLLLGLPIGMLLHIVFDGAFNSAALFWWPFLGSWGDVRVPSLGRGWWSVALDIVGVAILWWLYRRCQLDKADRRRDFVRHGTLIQTPT